jgi:DNA-binding transcriptional MerR regulator
VSDRGDDVAARRPVYSIGAVAKMLGVDASTLRAWEERYGLVVPHRSQGSQRVYSRDELDHLRFVIQAMDDGSSPADAHRLLEERLQVATTVSRPAADAPEVVILLAERDRYSAELFEYFLRTEGYDVCVAFDPAAVMDALADRHPQLTVLELMMAGGGLDLCSQVARSGDVPVLAVSALDLSEEALQAGASAFLAKPLDPLQFVSTVRDLLGDSALTRRSRQSVL